MIPPFSLSRLPRIIFGPKVRSQLPTLASTYGKRLLLVTGARHLQSSAHWEEMQAELRRVGLVWEMLTVKGEPSPQFVDDTVRSYRSDRFDAVIGIGGGSALDAAKAIAGLLVPGNSVMDHLEGVGPELPYKGPATPFVAVPTTAGTGSEATKNAVLSVQGTGGFKKSFRDDKLVAEIAIVDPDLLATCPPKVIAANGMDAFTQLLESYVSSNANAFTDALAWSGMEAAKDAMLDWYKNGEEARESQARMAYAALLSGITLAQVGLGSVHGLAAPLGAFFPIPHGAACGTLVAKATAVNIQALKERAENSIDLRKYAKVGRMLTGRPNLSEDEALGRLVETLEDWTKTMQLPRLSNYGVCASDIPRIVSNSRGSSMKTNPILLSDEDIANILMDRI